jgi:hypothetical protein
VEQYVTERIHNYVLLQVFEPYGLKVLGQIIALTGFIGLFIQPVWQLIRFFTMGSMQQNGEIAAGLRHARRADRPGRRLHLAAFAVPGHLHFGACGRRTLSRFTRPCRAGSLGGTSSRGQGRPRPHSWSTWKPRPGTAGRRTWMGRFEAGHDWFRARTSSGSSVPATRPPGCKSAPRRNR